MFWNSAKARITLAFFILVFVFMPAQAEPQSDCNVSQRSTLQNSLAGKDDGGRMPGSLRIESKSEDRQIAGVHRSVNVHSIRLTGIAPLAAFVVLERLNENWGGQILFFSIEPAKPAFFRPGQPFKATDESNFMLTAEMLMPAKGDCLEAILPDWSQKIARLMESHRKLLDISDASPPSLVQVGFQRKGLARGPERQQAICSFYYSHGSPEFDLDLFRAIEPFGRVTKQYNGGFRSPEISGWKIDLNLEAGFRRCDLSPVLSELIQKHGRALKRFGTGYCPGAGQHMVHIALSREGTQSLGKLRQKDRIYVPIRIDRDPDGESIVFEVRSRQRNPFYSQPQKQENDSMDGTEFLEQLTKNPAYTLYSELASLAFISRGRLALAMARSKDYSRTSSSISFRWFQGNAKEVFLAVFEKIKEPSAIEPRYISVRRQLDHWFLYLRFDPTASDIKHPLSSQRFRKVWKAVFEDPWTAARMEDLDLTLDPEDGEASVTVISRNPLPSVQDVRGIRATFAPGPEVFQNERSSGLHRTKIRWSMESVNPPK